MAGGSWEPTQPQVQAPAALPGPAPQPADAGAEPGRDQLPHTRSAPGATGRTRPAAPPEPGRGRPPPSRPPGPPNPRDFTSAGQASRPRPQEASPGSSRQRGLPRQDGLSLYPGRVRREGAAWSSAPPLFQSRFQPPNPKQPVHIVGTQ